MESSVPALEHLKSFGRLEDREDALKRKLGEEVIFRPISVDLRHWLDREIDIISRDPTPHPSADVSAASTPRSLSPVNQVGSMGSSTFHSLSSIEEIDETERLNERDHFSESPIEVLHATVLHETFALPTESNFVSLKEAGHKVDDAEGKEVTDTQPDASSDQDEQPSGKEPGLPRMERARYLPVLIGVVVLLLLTGLRYLRNHLPSPSSAIFQESKPITSRLHMVHRVLECSMTPYESLWNDDLNMCLEGSDWHEVQETNQNDTQLTTKNEIENILEAKRSTHDEHFRYDTEQIALPRRRWNLKDIFIRRPYALISRLLRSIFTRTPR